MKKILLFLFVFASISVIGQDKILMLSGHVLEGNVVDHDRHNIKYEMTKGSSTKTIELESYRVFSFTKDGKETVMYKRDSAIGNFLSEQEMRYFIWGAQDAMEHYHGKWAFFSGIGVGGVGGYFLAQSFVVVSVPLIYPIVTSIHKIHPKESYSRDPKLLNEPAYLTGYHKTTKSKRFFQALKGSLLGTVAGVGAFYAIN